MFSVVQNALDLDLAFIEKSLALKTKQSWRNAADVYLHGAHSLSVASVTLGANLTVPLRQGGLVTGFSDGPTINEVHGTILANYPAGTTKIQIKYKTNAIQSQFVGCQVGKLPEPITERCEYCHQLL